MNLLTTTAATAAAAHLNLDPSQIRRYCRAGRFPGAVQLGRD